MSTIFCGADTEEIKDILKVRLSKKRYTHSLNVAEAAKMLADKHGGDRDKCYLAGLVHDICKEIPIEEQLRMGVNSIVPLSPAEKAVPPLYHAAAGARYCEQVLHISDRDILMAVRFHTAARAEMSLTEEIIYLADLISEDRSYKDVGKMRKLASENIKKAMLEALCFSVSDVVSKGSLIPESTAQAYNYYAQMFRKD